MNDNQIKELMCELARFSTPELCDGMEDFRAMCWEIKPFVGGRIIGRAYTVDAPAGSSNLVTRAIEEAAEGDVIVIAGHGNCYGSLWGDHRSLCASLRKAAGVVIDGAFRDIEGCREAGFPVYARAVVCGALKKSDYGALKGPVCCGGVPVEQGDIICGDENGVVVIKPQEAEGVVERAPAKAKRQAEVRAEVLKTGRPKMF